MSAPTPCHLLPPGNTHAAQLPSPDTRPTSSLCSWPPPGRLPWCTSLDATMATPSSPSKLASSTSLLLLPWPQQGGSCSLTKFAVHTPPPANSSHPQHHNLPISIQDQAIGTGQLNLEGNRRSRGLHCHKSSKLRSPGGALPPGEEGVPGEEGPLPGEDGR